MARQRQSAKTKTPALEWAVGAAGALVFCAMLAVLVGVGVSGADAPPDIHIDVEAIERVESGYVLRFAARNEGDVTAADVDVIARLNGEEHAARFDYLPPHSKRRGGFFFERDPHGARIAAEGYNDP